MPYFRLSKTAAANEKLLNATDFHDKNLYLKSPAIAWNEARLVGEGDPPEWGMEYLCAPQLLPALPAKSSKSTTSDCDEEEPLESPQVGLPHD
ncbi:BZ3500_MvSof-1268-A1-R1_Chr5-2g07839 [Microbotryum saponariae]|uniref:BZ3500_MvSof-1268-A1-R1_Chr5-2g07839 protein n=1 Tax=Microbotryum saponariae TaxID=289078 RepID=A0A2X0KFW4_9BASI|nr:BZ3500_MvSof-1268-A1-R1_Chr5-2g07839 [Microbotryum saponariae]SDA05708.1 BZ3501_MvSof-1269-A2-R1_Chr5-2g07661 [Microbotryum saponariae]